MLGDEGEECFHIFISNVGKQEEGSNNVQSGVVVGVHESSIKMNGNLFNRRLITCVIRLENML